MSSAFSFFLSSQLASVYKLHRLAVKASPNHGACGNLRISTKACQSQRPPFLWKKSHTTKDKGEAGGGARNTLGKEEMTKLVLNSKPGLLGDR